MFEACKHDNIVCVDMYTVVLRILYTLKPVTAKTMLFLSVIVSES